MTTPIETRPFTARTDDGVTLRGDLLCPPAPRAVVLTLHAMMVNRRTMDRPAGRGLASTLAEAGLAVANLDFRAHGDSRPRVTEGALPTYDDYVLHDVPAMLTALRAAFPGLPVAVVGHSLGGHVTLITSGLLPERAPDALVMLGANLWLPACEPSPLRRLAKRATLTAFVTIARALGTFDAPRLRFGTEAESLPYVEQFVTFWRTDALRSRDGTLDYAAAIARARLPILSVASEGDRLLAHPASVRAFLARAHAARVTHRTVRPGDLSPRAPDHMGLVTSPASRPLWDDIARWLLATLP
ncbi:MAG: alpha/beta fold hydrolase [Polyangiaceae bacterium]